jgi:hypothetical protein
MTLLKKAQHEKSKRDAALFEDFKKALKEENK